MTKFMLIDVCGSNKTEKTSKYTKFSFIFCAILFPARCCYHKNVRYPLETLYANSDARFLGDEEPEDEGEGDPEEDLLQELLLLVLRGARAAGVVA